MNFYYKPASDPNRILEQTLEEAKYEMMMANYYVVGVLLGRAKSMIDENIDNSLIKGYEDICERYRKKLR